MLDGRNFACGGSESSSRTSCPSFRNEIQRSLTAKSRVSSPKWTRTGKPEVGVLVAIPARIGPG